MSTINDLCSVIVDCEHKTSPEDDSGKYFAVGTPAMRGNVIDHNQARRISHEIFIAWTRRLKPKFGDLLFAREAPVGLIVQIPVEENIAPGQRTVLMRPDPALADSRYLFYRLSSAVEQERLQAMAGGSTVAHLNVADIRAFRLDVPSLSQQQAIAEVLGALDDKIAANTKVAQVARDLVGAEYQNILSRAEETTILQQVLTLEYGKPLLAATRVPGQVQVFGSGGIVGFHDETFTAGPGIVVGRKGTAGAVHWAATNYYPIDTTFYVKSINPDVFSLVYCFFLLRSLKLTELNSDSAVPGLNRNDAYALKIRLPSDARIQEFTRISIPLIDLADQAERESATLAATRDALLPQLMSGALRIKDAKNAIEEVL